MEYHDVPPQQRPVNINAAPRFVEPQVHPVVDGYFRDKLKSATQIATRDIRAKKRAELGVGARFEAIGIKKGVAQKLNENQVGEIGQLIDKIELLDEQLEGAGTSPEIQRLQVLWMAAAKGDFTGVHAEIAQDIARASDAIYQHRQHSPMDSERYDAAVAEIAEWQASLQETPIELVNTRLGRQINRTVVGLVQQRDNTHMATLNKQLKNLQQVQKTANTLSQPK